MYKENFSMFIPVDAGWMDNFRRFMGFLTSDTEIKDRRCAAYLLATSVHEDRSLANKWKTTWDPIKETGGENAAYGQLETVVDWQGRPLDAKGARIPPVTDPAQIQRLAGKLVTIRGAKYEQSKLIQQRYYGRGYVQLTHQENYRGMDEALGLGGTLHVDPDLAIRDAAVSYKVISYGLRKGSFRGAKKHVTGQGIIGGHKLDDYINDSGADYLSARDIVNGNRDKATEIASYARTFQAILEAATLV
jgi:hypothetical protein